MTARVFAMCAGALSLGLACDGRAPEPPPAIDLSPASWTAGDLEEFTARQNRWGQAVPPPAARSAHAMISGTSSALAVRSGLEALKRGGSAVDAVLTTALAQVALVAGSYVSYAGIFFLTYYDAAEDKVYYLNAGFDTPRGELDPLTIPAERSGRTALVPGFFAGVEAAHQRFGKLPFDALFTPAIYFADRGFALNDLLAGYIDRRRLVLSRLPETRAIFSRADGRFYGAGDWFRQPALAETLRKVAARGSEYVYRGDWAAHLVAAVQADGGTITLEDLRAYAVVWSEPLTTTFRGYQVFAPGLPAAGGVNTIEALNVLEAAGFPARGSYRNDPESLFWFMQIHRLWLLGFLPAEVRDGLVEGVDLSPPSRATKATAAALWSAVERGTFALTTSPQRTGTHSDAIVAVDESGNVAALVHTINTDTWGATGIFVDGISIPDAAAFQQQRVLEVGAGGRLPEETEPILVFQGGAPVLAASSIGVTHYRTLPFVYNAVAYDLDAEEASLAPFLLDPDYESATSASDVVERVIDGAFEPGLLDATRDLGQPIRTVSAREAPLYLGYGVGIGIDPATSQLIGTAPPYLNGAALGY